MKEKKVLFSLMGISLVAVLFSIAWISYGNSCSTQVYAPGKGCGGMNTLLGGACDNLPSPCGLLSKKAELGLDDNQVSKLKELKSNSKKTKVKQHAELKILQIELQELLDEKTVDKNAAYAKLDAVGSLQMKMAKGCLDNKLAARGILTPEQLQKWEAVKKSCRKGDPGCMGKKAQGSQAKKDCGSKGWADARTQL
jgi:hypothetical protein